MLVQNIMCRIEHISVLSAITIIGQGTQSCFVGLQNTTKRLDLSKMSDKELRDQINRELLEQQYNKLFADTSATQVSKGRTILQDTLDVAGSVLAITGSDPQLAWNDLSLRLPNVSDQGRR